MTPRPTPRPADGPGKVPKLNDPHPVDRAGTGPTDPTGTAPDRSGAVDQAPLQTLGTRIRPELMERLRWAAFTERRSVQSLVDEALERYLPDLPPRP